MRAAVLMACAGVLAASAAHAGGEPDGRALYRGDIAFGAGRESTANRLPASLAACANCHGDSAQGGREGALVIPPITWAALMAEAAGEAFYATDADILRAIRNGEGRGGRRLGAAMPRYRLSSQEAVALIDYLRRVGSRDDRPPGVTVDAVRLGTLLPLTGPAAWAGREILAGLDDRMHAINAAGGVHGRRLTLVAVDSGDLDAAVRLLTSPVHALVGSLWAGDPDSFASLMAGRRVANLASLTARARARDASIWDLDLLAPLDVQQTVLEAALGRCGGDRWAVSIPGAPPPRASPVQWIAEADPRGVPDADSCLGGVLSSAGPILDDRLSGWRKVIVSPLPAALLSSRRVEAASTWRRLGQVAAGVAIELLSRAGPSLSERSTLDLAPGLNGFELVPGAPMRVGPGRRYAWDPETIVFDRASEARHERGFAVPLRRGGAEP